MATNLTYEEMYQNLKANATPYTAEDACAEQHAAKAQFVLKLYQSILSGIQAKAAHGGSYHYIDKLEGLEVILVLLQELGYTLIPEGNHIKVAWTTKEEI